MLKSLYLSSVESLGYKKYSFEELKSHVEKALDEEVKITLMNSDSKTKVKLDCAGNIKNEVPFSIFIGAYAVDRGVTFNNMISFVFGRSPKVTNLDSSLQQLRILGARAKEDLPVVTRIYCTKTQLEKWKEFARIDLESSELVELNKALINGFTEKYGINNFEGDHYVEIKTEDATKLLLNSYTAISSDRVNLLNILEQSLFFLEWMKKEYGDKVMLYCKYDRKRKLKRSNGKDDDAPDSGASGDYNYAKKIAKNIQCC